MTLFAMLLIVALVVFSAIFVILWLRAANKADKIDKELDECQTVNVIFGDMIDMISQKYNINEDTIQHVYEDAQEKYKKEMEDLFRQAKGE